jgi:hypothetical protein
MPRKGYKTITVSEEVYDIITHQWLKNKKFYIRKGVTTFSGYLAYISQREEQEEKHIPQ